MAHITQKITPNLWFDTQAEEAAKFYTSVFNNAKILNTSHYTEAGKEVHGQPKGQVMTVEFEVEGYAFLALNGGPYFTLNPSISFIVNCTSKDEVDELWEKLSDDGKILMPLDAYPFSQRYGWAQDKFGVSWQLILSNPEGEERPKIVPSMMFVGDNAGKAEEAIKFYTSVFHDAKLGNIARYGADQQPDTEGTIMFADFTLEGQWFAAMDSAQKHDFTFSEATSLVVNCETQEEVDYYWEKLSVVPESEQCGWLKDKFGVSWQIIPKQLSELLSDANQEKSSRVMQAMLKMKKIDIQGLQDA
jgi:predicted 3-demethylubiquinone-9 3-methyltransferase (glyoxalase superfamily)